MTDDGFESIRADYEKTRQPNDSSIPVILVNLPKCSKCGEWMILVRLFHAETHLREYWKCGNPKCRHKVKIDDEGYAIGDPLHDKIKAADNDNSN